MLGNLIDRIGRKHWSDEEVRKYVGPSIQAWLSHAADPALRIRSASGGAITALLADWLAAGEIDGALVCKGVVVDGKVRARMAIATSMEELLEAQTSKYVETPFLKEALPLIRAFEGRLAVTALPCDVTALKRWCEKDPTLASKVQMTIGLVCGHNSRTALIDEITSQLESQAGARLCAYTFRRGAWRGWLEAEFEGGGKITRKTGFFNDYQNLYFFSQKKCVACSDHFAYKADVVAGDVWLYRLRDDEVKRTGLFSRSKAGHESVMRSLARGALVAEPLSVRDILDGQSRVAPYHYNVTARHRAGRLLGVKIKDTVNEPVKWHAWLAAWITLFNIKWSEHPKYSRLVFKVPRRVMKAYLYVLKGLETLR